MTMPINGAKGWGVFIGAVIAALLGSGSGVYVYMQRVTPEQLQTIARPDPATGTDLRKVSEVLERHLALHPDQTKRFDARLSVVESNQRIIMQNQERILDRL